MFQGFNTDDPSNSVSLLAGFIITFLGVHLLEISRKPAAGIHVANGHNALEGGLMNPRLSITGRMSIDGWTGAAGTPIGGGPSLASGHVRRGSGNRQSTTLFNAFDEDDDGMDGVGLERLPAVEEGDDYDDDADERTHLRSNGHRDRHPHHQKSGSRSGSHSPRGSQGDSRRSPR